MPFPPLFWEKGGALLVKQMPGWPQRALPEEGSWSWLPARVGLGGAQLGSLGK